MLATFFYLSQVVLRVTYNSGESLTFVKSGTVGGKGYRTTLKSFLLDFLVFWRVHNVHKFLSDLVVVKTKGFENQLWKDVIKGDSVQLYFSKPTIFMLRSHNFLAASSS